MPCCSQCGAETGRIIRRGKLEVSEAPFTVTYDGRRLKVTTCQARAMFELCRRGRVSSELLMDMMTGPECNRPRNSIATQISSLRRLLPDEFEIRAKHGWGYELVTNSQS